MSEQLKTIFSGIQPSGKITIGNYFGSIRNWINMQDEFNGIYCVVDMHAITVTQQPAELRANTLELLAWYLASGLKPESNTIFIQSHVSAHAELTWVLNTITYLGELNRMTQFKDKSRKLNSSSINMGLMDYPVLMASDILLYNADLVPVGVDQKQHLELARDLAERFNSRYSPTFVVPDGYIPKVGAKIMSLTDATAKMSKSGDNENSYVLLSDSADAMRAKFRRATTDSDTVIRYGEDKKEISNLLTIYSLASNTSIEDAVKHFEGKGYGDFKNEVAEAVIELFIPIQQKQQQLLKDKTYLSEVYKKGAEDAERIARKTLSKVYRKIGFIPREF